MTPYRLFQLQRQNRPDGPWTDVGARVSPNGYDDLVQAADDRQAEAYRRAGPGGPERAVKWRIRAFTLATKTWTTEYVPQVLPQAPRVLDRHSRSRH